MDRQKFITGRLHYVENCIKSAVEEGVGNVWHMNFQVESGSNGEEEAEGGKADGRSKGVMEINTVAVFETFDNKAGIAAFNRTISMLLDLENPFAWNRLALGWSKNNTVSVISVQGCEFCIRSLDPFSSIKAGAGLMNGLRFVMMMKGGISGGLEKRRKGESMGSEREGKTLSSEKSEGLEGAEGDGGEELEVQGGGRAEEGEERDGRRKSCGVEGRGRLENKGGEEVAGAGRFGDGGRRVVEEGMGGEGEGGEVGAEREGGGGGGKEEIWVVEMTMEVLEGHRKVAKRAP
ncbi:unnamed protein product [Closterium sp. NIES-54]